ncbi:hypothetical protein EDM56_09790 [Brevibacillus fluminis]|uniref:Arginase n=1 Tax=Brevibacillus fluminis TaxID=511487 RepID=A0A3M8DPU5_9BACL|nr:UPF0489 family protein [Brevibacillus fluminis]RNB89481.1 hypothetical protein EDM56_09790 [Brevibacillus fluminis]
MEWFDDFNWKICFPEQRIYLMRQHNWAFAAWEIERLKGALDARSFLVHVDAHLDDTPDGVFVAGLKEAASVEQLLAVAQGHDYTSGQVCPPDVMQIDNFIWAAVARDTIGETIFVSHQEEEVLSLAQIRQEATQKRNENCQSIIAKLPPDCAYTDERFLDIESFLDGFDRERLHRGRTVILDLDLDYFNVSRGEEAKLLPDAQIRAYLQALRELWLWDVITVAISPEYCGGKQQAAHLLGLFLESFSLSLSDGQKW